MNANVITQNGPDSGDIQYESLCILHFNDCYNVEPCDKEPVGGAARFVNALHQFDHLDPLILFSGDIIAPSIMSSFTKGEQMLPVLERCNVHCALFGNHEFDFGLDCLLAFVARTNFPWLMSNVIDKNTGLPLGGGKITHIIEKGDLKIGLIGLIEEEWLSTLVLDEDDIKYTDFVPEGRRLAKTLKEENGVHFVIALTHMRTHNDIRLAEQVEEVDLILGGHDHVYEIRKVNGKLVIKSGTDFRQFSKLTLVYDHGNHKIRDIQVDEINITSDIGEDPYLIAELNKFKTVLEEKMENTVAILDCDLDGRFSSVRTKETNLGNLITDVMLYAVPDADFALLNSGTLRSDRIHPKGALKMRDLVNILPYMESLLVINIDGRQTYRALENGVSQFPKFEGRFPQVSGISFKFDPSKPSGSRVDINSIMIQGEPLVEDKIYKMVTKEFIVQGKDGYEVLKECSIYKNTEQCLTLLQAVNEYLETYKLIQALNDNSIISNGKKNSIRRNSLKIILPQAAANLKNSNDYVCHLNPQMENRIII
ncbi:5' nucleotidase-like protein [Dermatophagoides farinae]|uniref:5' nucleotidase-like protein n=1 Tax=Dermatophagoides farinae TaxID=6954 RepID=A0A9D4P1Q9_DERFA|nr:mannosylglucosyl-3-phosphoglycerate phosphatase-like [Dermatophagoides farinae]XP_046911304.1 mannosylglucosyl-3-phosphoglycerate phosphatase-like [Dermatophagoides farinae]KAH7642407.1 5' nucleotidase-like protein [Dermatophagoides farinae]